MISIKNLQKHYTLNKKSIPILKDINITLVPGEMTCLTGESGCGKSTLFNILGGLDDYDGGEYLFNEKDVKSFSEKDWSSFRAKNIGFIFQSFSLIPHLSALKNVEISMTSNKIPKSERGKRAKALLDSVGLKNRYDYILSQLSGGKKQRVAIARALANDPDIMLADEPTGTLDSKSSKQVMAILKSIAERGKIVLVVTHSSELSQLGDKVIEMKDGKIECVRRAAG
ncbi:MULTISPECIES: ABC transporter ATP-binding protein [unclassified Sporolactobacillus]|uniref:ABC transporter ATP-binding protein n=1 Tax=unclassified Sporolactobacillus TaxID=2628533 RepID=UPI002367FF46|nr:ABC transporter ATP-binding protein [Sporolactobacillus sp. CQH2019]MDD9149636.1 ABC transporter ATP-binding protein [Sporolactobacillus sp. CQH2019]